jgi:hypothetical protein
MRVISAIYDKQGRDYGVMAKNLWASALKAGYNISMYALSEDPMDTYEHRGSYRTSCYFKPEIILKALTEGTEDVLWLDVDCLVKDHVNDILGDCDVAVTLRRGFGLRDIYDGYCNAGVMAFRNNHAAREFISRWIANIPGSRADQDALNKTLLDHTLFQKYDEIVDCGFARVMVRSCDKYNNFYLDEDNQNARIYHVKGHLREQFYNDYATRVLGSEAKLIEVANAC